MNELLLVFYDWCTAARTAREWRRFAATLVSTLLVVAAAIVLTTLRIILD